MKNWAEYRRQLTGMFASMAATNPDTLRGIALLGNAAPAPQTLDVRTRELIALAVAVTTRCDGCIAIHAELAQKAGATREQVSEALGVAVALNAGAALVYSARAMDAFSSSTAPQ